MAIRFMIDRALKAAPAKNLHFTRLRRQRVGE
jgi:hypothetical protein